MYTKLENIFDPLDVNIEQRFIVCNPVSPANVHTSHAS